MHRYLRCSIYIAAMTVLFSGCSKKAEPTLKTQPEEEIKHEITGMASQGDLVQKVESGDKVMIPTPGLGEDFPSIIIPPVIIGEVIANDTKLDEFDENEEEKFDDEIDITPTNTPEIIDEEAKAGWVSKDKTRAMIDNEGTVLCIEVDNNRVIITGYTELKKDEIKIPDMIDGKPVTEIKSEAFAHANMKEIVIPTNVKSIGEYAFYGCNELKRIKLPESVKTIGDFSLANCPKLIMIEVDDKNANFCTEDGILFNKKKTELIKYPSGYRNSNYVIPGPVVVIKKGAFSMSSNLTKLTFSGKVQVIEQEAFAGCKNLKVELPENITKIGKYAFADCYAIEDLILPSEVSKIEEGAFSGCENLQRVVFPSYLEDIGYSAFANCYALSEVNFFSFTDTIGGMAFAFCTNLKNFTVPDGTTEISDMAFYGCSGLMTIEIPSSVSYFGTGILDQARQAKIKADTDSDAYEYAMKNKLSWEPLTK